MLERDRRIYGRCVRLMIDGVESLLCHEPGELFRDGREIPLATPYFFHAFQSDLEDYAEQLEKLGLLRPLIDPPGHACCFELVCGSEEAERIAYERASSGAPLPRLLASLFYFASDKVGMTDEIGVEFPLGCYARDVMPDMCELGYAARKGQGYVWLPRFQEILDIKVV